MSESFKIEVLSRLVTILDRLGIPYAIGGSMASSVFGQIRFTEDADLCVEPFESRADSFYQAVQSEFYVSQEAMLYALRNRTSFNLIHLETAFKIDIFIPRKNDFDGQLITRRRLATIVDTSTVQMSFVSPEDTILLKLRWYVEGGEVSQRQWDDIMGVLRVQAKSLDRVYLVQWAQRLGVNHLLDRAIQQAVTRQEK